MHNGSINFTLLPESLPFLVYQRTEYIKKISQMYYDDMKTTFDFLLPYLPKQAYSILDIGSGMAGIDVFLGKHYRNAKITLLDKNGIEDKVKIGYQKSVNEFGAYNSFKYATRLLVQNGITNIEFCNIAEKSFPKGPFDIVISLLSWGFHYPANTYAEDVERSTEDHSIIILDLRKDTPRPFPGGTIIFEAEKYVRLLYVKGQI